MCLARTVHPEGPNQLYKAYLKATKRPHGYLVLDLAQDTDDRLRFRTHIFPEEYPPTFYVHVTDDETDKIELSRPSRTEISTAQITESHNCKRKPRNVKQYKRMRSECIKRKLKSVRLR
jgi:hypothetical protein